MDIGVKKDKNSITGKILFFDIDGTLYDFNGHMPASTLRALRLARCAGHHLVICSGRAKYQVYPELFELFDGYVGATGSYIVQEGNVIYEHFMPENVLKEAVDVIGQSDGLLAAMTEEGLILNQECNDYLVDKFTKQGVKQKDIERLMGDVIITPDLTGYGNIQKMLYHRSKWNVSQISDRLDHCCDITASSFEASGDNSGEITMKDINKSFGMKYYIDRIGGKAEDTIAFGDGPNDFDMIEFAGIGVAMGNAGDGLKKLADYVTTDVLNDGIASAMEHFGII